MAAYTTLKRQDLNPHLQNLGLGTCLQLEPVSAGIENSTYFVTTRQSHSPNTPQTTSSTTQEWVLTLFENRTTSEVGFILRLQLYLQQNGLPVPELAHHNQGGLLSIQGKPAALFNKCEGQHPNPSDVAACRQMGRALAQVHNATVDYAEKRVNDRGLRWILSQLQATQLHLNTLQLPYLDQRSPSLLRQAEEILLTNQQHLGTLPTCVIHGDGFPDNVLFAEGKMTALIDFDNACNEAALIDLAICVHAWCYEFGEHGCQFHLPRAQALLSSYQQTRSLSEGELAAWRWVQVWAACRFWLSRLQHWQITQSAPSSLSQASSNINHPKHPVHYQWILQDVLKDTTSSDTLTDLLTT